MYIMGISDYHTESETTNYPARVGNKEQHRKGNTLNQKPSTV